MTCSLRPYLTIAHGLRGYYAVLMWWNDEDGGFWEPWQTGLCSYRTAAAAEGDAREWAQAEGLEFRR